MIQKLKNQKNLKKEASGSLDARVLAYCAVAGGALLAAQPAEAAVVKSGVKNLSLADNQTVGVDLDGNSTVDFTFLNFADQSRFTTQQRVVVYKTTFSSTWKTYNYDIIRNFQSNILNLGLTPNNAIAQKAAAGSPFNPANVVLAQGDAVPGAGLNWFNGAAQGNAPLSFRAERKIVLGSTYDSTLKTFVVTSSENFYSAGGAFDKKTGYLGVRFQIEENTHYGWIKYQGDNSTDNGTTVSGRIVEWAYEDVPFEPIYVDAEPPAPPCTLALTPGRINKLTSIIMPVTGIIIRGNESANFTRDSEISWGTDTIRTLFKLRLSSKTILALVRVKPLLLQGDDTFEVTVDDCTGELGVVALR